MKAQLYLYNEFRIRLQQPYKLFKNTYLDRIAPVFNNIDKEAKEVRDECFKELGRSFNPERDDEGDCAEAALQKGLDYYEEMSLMKYNTQLMWISTLYQFWEQQVRKFLYKEISRTHHLIDKHNNEIKFKDFCTNGIRGIKDEFMDFNENLKELNSWNNIDELRLLDNVIKHGDGISASNLNKIKPEFFIDPGTKQNLFKLYNNTLNNIVLNVKDEDYVRYCKSLIEFWNELPERLYSKS